MAVGHKYQRVFQRVEKQFAGYADRCGATLEVCTKPPDPGFHRPLLVQKLLLPDQYAHYEWLAVLDLDLLISRTAPSLFDFAVDGMGLGAVPDPRDTFGFRNVALRYWKRPEISAETHASYFVGRGYPAHSGKPLSINGGVWLCRPRAIAADLKDAYYSDFRELLGKESAEEGMMGFVSQSRGLFFPLPETLNTQVLYAIFDAADTALMALARLRYLKALHALEHTALTPRVPYPNRYVNLVRQLLQSNHIVHFAGKFPYLRLA